MEHGVYICSWSRSSDGYTLWVKARPHVRASAPTYAEAEERLIEAIQDAGGATQAVMEFDPPLPKSTLEEKYSGPEIYLTGGDDRFETDAPRWKWSESAREVDERLRWLDAFYDEPVCRKCKYTSGRRNNKPVTLTYAPGKYDGAFGSFGTDGGPNHQLVSEEFLALLTPDEKRNLEFQPTIRKRGRKFFELVGPEGPPHVAVAGIKISGWRCTLCDHRTWGYWGRRNGDKLLRCKIRFLGSVKRRVYCRHVSRSPACGHSASLDGIAWQKRDAWFCKSSPRGRA
jgi:hypothetical protein